MEQSFILFKNKNFIYYFISDIIGNIGTGISIIGFSWFVLELTNQNEKLGIYTAISLLSSFTISLFIGTIVDRYNPRSILFFSNTVQAGLFIFILILSGLKLLPPEIIYVLAVISGAGYTIYITASRALVQELLKKENLIDGISFIEISLQIGMLIASGTAGFIYRYYGFNSILGINTLSFILSIIFLCKIKYKFDDRTNNEKSYISQLVDGIQYLTRDKFVLIFGILVFTPYIVTVASNVILPGYISQHLSASSMEFGFSDMLFGTGAFLAGFLTSMLVKKFSKKVFVFLLFVLSITSLAFLFLNNSISGLYIAYFLFGLGNTSLKIILNTMIMQTIPNHLYGRVIAFLIAFTSIIQIFLTYGIGYLIDIIPVTYGYLILSVIMSLGLCLIMYIWAEIKKADAA